MSQVSASRSPSSLFRSLVAAGLFLVVAVGGLSVLRYRAHVTEQRELYQQYLLLNAWKPAAQRAYAAFVPLLNEVEHVSPDAPNEAELERLRSQLMAGSESVKKMHGLAYTPRVGQFHDFSLDISRLLLDYSANLDQVHSANHLADPKDRMAAARLAAAPDLPRSFGTQSQVLAIENAVITKESASDDATLKRKALWEIRHEFSFSLQGRARLEEAIYAPDEVPPGLDLAFAKRL